MKKKSKSLWPVMSRALLCLLFFPLFGDLVLGGDGNANHLLDVSPNLCWSPDISVNDGNESHSVPQIGIEGWDALNVFASMVNMELPVLHGDFNGKLADLPSLVRSPLERDSDKSEDAGNSRSYGSADDGSDGSVHNVVYALLGYVVGSSVAFMALLWFFFLHNSVYSPVGISEADVS